MMQSSYFKKIITEPLVHFLIIAILFFVIYDWLAPPQIDDSVITMSSNRIEQLKRGFEKTWTRSPTEKELNKMIEDYALDEIYAREAKALGLGENDDVIRRRLRQKMEFILQDLSELKQPTQAELSDFYQTNIDKYRTDNIYSFEQVYIATNRSQADVEQLLAQQKQRIAQGLSPQGEPSMLPGTLDENTTHQVNRLFGKDFTSELDNLAIGEWTGPIQSGLGLHFVKISKKVQGGAPSIDKIKNKLIKNWQYQKSKELKEEYQQELLTKYRIDISPSSDLAKQ